MLRKKKRFECRQQFTARAFKWPIDFCSNDQQENGRGLLWFTVKRKVLKKMLEMIIKTLELMDQLDY